VQAIVHAYPGYVPADVVAAAIQMLDTWLDPNVWGTQPSSSSQAADQWANNTAARINEAIDWLNRADGVHYVDTPLLRKAGGAWGAVDIPLTGVAPLPLSGNHIITVA
jgi:hypothetical protein